MVPKATGGGSEARRGERSEGPRTPDDSPQVRSPGRCAGGAPKISCHGGRGLVAGDQVPDIRVRPSNDLDARLDTPYCIPYTVCNTLFDAPPGGLLTAMPAELFENLRLELRRGCLVLAVLAHLRAEHYGYTLRKALAEHGLAIDEGTLYPLLRRLESQGLLVSEWREEDKRKKRFYRLSSDGERILDQLLTEWRTINRSLDRILSDDQQPLEASYASCLVEV